MNTHLIISTSNELLRVAAADYCFSTSAAGLTRYDANYLAARLPDEWLQMEDKLQAMQ